MDVIGIGEGKAPEALRNVCNRFVLIENLVETPPEATKGKTATTGKQDPTKAIPLILRAMDKVNSDDDWCPMGPIGQYIMADNPDFDTRTYGEVKLSDLIKKLKRFETRKEGNQLMLRRVD